MACESTGRDRLVVSSSCVEGGGKRSSQFREPRSLDSDASDVTVVLKTELLNKSIKIKIKCDYSRVIEPLLRDEGRPSGIYAVTRMRWRHEDSRSTREGVVTRSWCLAFQEQANFF